MESVLHHDETLGNCCGKQDQIRILLIGRTQNGKSSLVKSILSYGGHHNLSREVKRGNNNVSQTQVVTTYGRKIGLKKHLLKDKQGNNIHFVPERIQQFEQAGLEHHAVPSGHHVHLKILDTPGLGDSNNYKAAAAMFKHKSITELSTLKIVDETHKLEIMQRLLDEGSIHGVCFVIKWDEPFSNSMQEDIHTYLEVFEKSKLEAVKYFVLHTAVLPGSRGRLDERRTEFEKKFAFAARHFFLESDPDPAISLEIYLSQREICNFLTALAANKACPVPDLKYTKSGPQQSLDADLRNLLGPDGLGGVVSMKLADLKKKIEEINAEIESISQQLERTKKRKSAKEAKIKELDTDDLIDIDDPVTQEETWKLWRSSTIFFDIPTSTVIRQVVKDPDNSNWSEESGKGTCQFHAKYTGPSRTSIKATVTLKGYKRELFKVNLDAHREELQEYIDTIESLTKQESAHAMEKGILEKDAENLKDIKIGLETDIERTNSRDLSVKNAQRNCLYLTICNPIAMSLAYGLVQEIPKSYLPLTLNGTTREISFGQLDKQRNRWKKMLSDIETVLRAFESDRKRKQAMVESLERYRNNVQGLRSWFDGKMSKRPMLEVGTLAEAFRPYVRQEIRQNLELLELDLTTRAGNLDERLEGLWECEVHYLDDLISEIRKAIKEAKKLIQTNVSERKEWVTYHQICHTTIAAIDETARLCRDDKLPPGPFYIVHKVLNADNARGIDPYLRLFDELLAAYHLRDSGKIMVLRRELDMAD